MVNILLHDGTIMAMRRIIRFFIGYEFNTTFSNTSVLSWLSVLLVEETGVPAENHSPVIDKFQW
jgi:hypothetical protein